MIPRFVKVQINFQNAEYQAVILNNYDGNISGVLTKIFNNQMSLANSLRFMGHLMKRVLDSTRDYHKFNHKIMESLFTDEQGIKITLSRKSIQKERRKEKLLDTMLWNIISCKY